MTITYLPGIYLEDNTPWRDGGQFRTGRRDPLKAVIEVHSTESGQRATALDVARFIQRRSGAGSYHLVGDAAGTIVQLIDFDNEAFHDRTGSNRWSIGISLCMDADEWPDLMGNRSDRALKLIDVAAHMADIAADHIERAGLGRPLPIHLGKVASDLPAATGFISHGRRDPDRRTDPGLDFPWPEFFDRYQDISGTKARRAANWAAAQRRLTAMGYEPGPADNIPGRRTLDATWAALDDLEAARG